MLNDEQPVVSRALYIGEAAKMAGVTVKAIRYYERIGIAPKPPRTQGGHRCIRR